MNMWSGAFIDRSECYSSAAPGLQTIEGTNEHFQVSNFKDQLAELTRGTDEVLPEDGLAAKLKMDRPLIVKAGFDPTAPDLHIGHTVLINKMRQFQEFGHELVFLIGDFTGMIGDPSGKNATRPPLSREEIQANAETYETQIFKILDQKRYEGGQPISIHEFLYPIVQGYDSVALKADVELGGTDQKFNLLVGRQLQQDYGQEPQLVMTTPLLEGLDGVQKMSKSLGNYVGITDAPGDMFGKLMSISDDLMWRYFEVLSFRTLEDIGGLRAAVDDGMNPRDVKFELGMEIVARFHDDQAAEAAKQEFIARFREGAMPEDMPELTLEVKDGALGIAHLLRDAGLVSSTSEAFRMIKQGAVRIDGERVEDRALTIDAGSTNVYQVGRRRFARVSLT
jgi:tyrosyl-tRNA synthetase